jgi:ATP-dependent Lhr-like helicase
LLLKSEESANAAVESGMNSACAAQIPVVSSPPELEWAHPVVQEWFVRRFGTPTEPQVAGWPAILRGEATLISAPTGSGKTLAAFLVCIDKLLRAAIEGRLLPQTQVVYVSPLKALSNDVQKNLEGPLREIQELALERGYLCPEIRAGVRTGDTLAKDRAAMLKHPPHILVTTPESLYILVTANKPRQNLARVSTVIVDEIHAIADDKRGSHLALTLERLDALVCGENRLCAGAMLTGLSEAPQRIGLSATQNPIELIAGFLTGAAQERGPATVVQVGQRRELDLAIEVPSAELGSLTTIAMWEEIYDKLAALALEHRSTLVFVNTRRLVEKISFELAARLGPEAVAAHHGSLSRALRLDAEQRLKKGEIRILVATASLELGIDIGNVDLVCQIATTRSVSVAMQRVGRAGHWRGATPKGRLFAMTRDDLVEQCALVRAMRTGELDRLEIPEEPIDVLMQQIVAACGAESWSEAALYEVFRRAWPYRNLTLETFEEIVALLHEGIESTRGRYGAYLLRDRVNGQLHARRGARMVAIGNGGAIPDTSLFAVMLQPENVQIATLDEHFAVDSSPGDVVLLGNTSWRIQRIDPSGKVLVEDAHGAPPSIPFWEGEAPQRTDILSNGVSDLRAEIDRRTSLLTANDLVRGCGSPESAVQMAGVLEWIAGECSVEESAARQLVAYIVNGRAVLGAVPTNRTIIAERFFDEGGGQQLILHAPFGGRLNKAWGLALRKRFCRGFNFELQAAATDNGINISLAEQHSFPLADVFRFLTEQTARELLEQASIPSPLFKNRWRWAAGRSLQLLRMQKGKRVAPQVQRTRSDDLLASVFPHASACPETMVGDIEIPDHPLVREVMRDTLSEAMDIDGLNEILRGIDSGEIRCLAVDTPVPSQFAHQFIDAMPYSFLDPEDAAARRTRAVSLNKSLPDGLLEGGRRLDPQAIATVREQLWPDVRDEHELHDLLLSLVLLPVEFVASAPERSTKGIHHWELFFERLQQHGRARRIELDGGAAWVAAERMPEAALLWPQSVDAGGSESSVGSEKAAMLVVQGWLQLLGPTTAARLSEIVGAEPAALYQALLAMEMQGIAMRGVFEQPEPEGDQPQAIEWCERRILHRIHRLMVRSQRQRVEPVPATVFMRWLLTWHHMSPASDEERTLSGEEAVLRAIEQMEGFEAPAAEWERSLLPARVPDYDPRWLDTLCLSGVVGWGRVSPHPAWQKVAGEAKAAPRRIIPSSAAPITFYLREAAEWMYTTVAAKRIDEWTLAQSLSPEAQCLRSLLAERGAAFTADLQRISGLSKLQTTTALWELVAAGIAAADGFDQLRAMMDPRRKSVALAQTPATSLRKRAAARTTAGRWSLLWDPSAPPAQETQASARQLAHAGEDERNRMIDAARQADASIETHARTLLARYGVVFRELLARETNAPAWRDVAPMLRRLEARGEIRGGRFVSGPFGEQFALEEAVEGLRAARTRREETPVVLSAADPLNLVGILLPGERVAAVPGRQVQLFEAAPQAVDARASRMPEPALVIQPATLWSEVHAP